MQNSKQLITDACEGIRGQRVPIFDLLLNDAVIEYFSGMKLDCGHDFEASLTAVRNALDGTRIIAVPNKDGAQWIDDIGNVWEARRWTSWIKKHAFNDLESWKKWIISYIEQVDAMPAHTDEEIAAIRMQQFDLNQKLGETLFIHCTPSTAINTALFAYCGLEIFSYLWMDERDLALRWLNAITRATSRYIDVYADKEISMLAMIYSDVAYKQRLMFSKAAMREMGFFDDVAQICNQCHARGLKVIFHSDGYIMDIIPDLISAGIDGLNPIEKAAGMDIYKIRKMYPDLILVGGVDVTHLLPFGTPDDVRKETRHIINEVGSNGRLLIGSSTELDNSVPLENYLAFHDEVMRG